MFKNFLFLLILTSIFLTGSKFHFQETPVKSPAEEQATFVLEKGLKIQLVASEPMIQDPIVMNFDEKGRLWVVEMRGYMPDVEGKNEKEQVGRISVLEDENGDGLMDKSTIYMDSLVLPRAMALIKGGILVAENQALWEALDLNGDLKADTKTLIDKNYAGSTAPEHAGNGLLRNLDNWYYNAKSKSRYKKIDNHWIRDSTEFRGQWGMSQDNKGRLVYNYNWSQLHGDLVPPNYLSRNKNHTPSSGIDHGLTIDRRVYPIRETPAVNRGYIPGTLDTKNRLLEFTAACAPLVYRESTLPKEYFGNVFVCEPTGNLVKRNLIQENGIDVIANDPHPGIEFLASTDERFRPVNLASGPDGALYVVDMYKGIMQHVLYETPYLKEQYLKRGLDKYLNKGRIWRIVPENWEPKKQQKLSGLNVNGLVAKLSSNDGWVRDMAQKLLVEKEDKSAEDALVKLAKTGSNFGRLHAVWTLEGLNLINQDLLFQLVADSNVLISNTALRILERFVKNDKVKTAKLSELLLKISGKATIEQNLQIALSSEILEKAVKFRLLANILDKFGSSTVIRDATLSSLQSNEYDFLKYLVANLKWQKQNVEKSIFLEMLTTSIIRNNNAKELESLLDQLVVNNNKSLNWVQNSILSGLSVQSGNISKPIRLSKQPKLFARNNNLIEQNTLQKINAMFEWPGFVQTKQVEKNQILLNPEEQKMFAKGRIQYLNTCSGCHGAEGKGLPRFAPTLVGSDWVTGDETRLALIVLHGLEGPIVVKGKKYDAPDILPIMPAHSTLDDASITNILTYIRNEWGNNGGPLSKSLIGKTRHTTQGRVVPWLADDLNKHITKLGEAKQN